MADLTRCETMIRGGSFMTLGPRLWLRCTNPAHWLATDTASGEQQGVCDSCAVQAIKQLAADSYELDWIPGAVVDGVQPTTKEQGK